MPSTPSAAKRLFRGLRSNLDAAAIFAAGVLLRVQYMFLTPFDVRAHDAFDHLRYVTHMMTWWRIPERADGYEMHQPPLYYVLEAAWLRVDLWLGREATSVQDAQVLSLLLSIVSLGAAFWIARILFPRKEQRASFLLCCGMLATVPGWIFFASGINNDVLSLLSTLVSIALLLRWWQTGSFPDWLLASLAVGVGTIVKMNAVLVLPMLLACLFLRSGMTFAKKCKWALAPLVLCGAIAGPLFVKRLVEGIMGVLLTPSEGSGFDPRLVLSNNPLFFFIFRIAESVFSPFVQVWEPGTGREYFWEYLFKSSLFGEWQIPSLLALSQGVIASGMGVLLLAAVGVGVAIWRKQTTWLIPLAVITVVSLAAILTLRILHRCVCLQDFRLVPQLAVPIAALSAGGLQWMSVRWKMAAMLVLLAFCLLSASLILAITHV